MPKRTKRSKSKSRTKGWRNSAPRSINPRRALYKRCGSRCFLMPGKLKYPICSKTSRSCKPDCRGLLASIIRAKQYSRSPSTAKKARNIARKSRCSWA